MVHKNVVINALSNEYFPQKALAVSKYTPILFCANKQNSRSLFSTSQRALDKYLDEMSSSFRFIFF